MLLLVFKYSNKKLFVEHRFTFEYFTKLKSYSLFVTIIELLIKIPESWLCIHILDPT